MGSAPKKWNLADLVDFEVLLGEGGEVPVAAAERRRFGEVLAGLGKRDRAAQRRLGLRAWLEERREREEPEAGDRVHLGLRAVGLLLGLLMFLAGVGVMRGLLIEMAGEGRLYNLWIFLGVALGLQWLILLAGLFGYFFLRGKGSPGTVVGVVLGGLVRRFSSGVPKETWQRLRSPAGAYRSVIAWRLARMSQGVAICFNLGLMAGFAGCLWFFGVRYYFESAVAPLSWNHLYSLAEWMALPWSWSGFALPPPRADFDFDLLTTYFFSADVGRELSLFLMMALAVWGLLPRILFWVVAWHRECGALGRLDFQERRHRVLWRNLARDERETLLEGPADGVVLLKVGGVQVEGAVLREFLLRKLRVHVEEEYAAAVLDEEGEARALAAIRKAPLGVVFLVEGWALSPKEMRALYERVRAVGGERMLRFLVVGALREGVPSAPEPGEYAQWETFVDGLRDPAAEVVGYEQLEAVGTEG